MRDAEAALREAEGMVSKLEEALKEESDKVKRLEGLLASAPVGPSGELESELSDEMRKLLAEKVAMQVGGILVPSVCSLLPVYEIEYTYQSALSWL